VETRELGDGLLFEVFRRGTDFDIESSPTFHVGGKRI
jgi:hypothetical protein